MKEESKVAICSIDSPQYEPSSLFSTPQTINEFISSRQSPIEIKERQEDLIAQKPQLLNISVINNKANQYQSLLQQHNFGSRNKNEYFQNNQRNCYSSAKMRVLNNESKNQSTEAESRIQPAILRSGNKLNASSQNFSLLDHSLILNKSLQKLREPRDTGKIYDLLIEYQRLTNEKFNWLQKQMELQRQDYESKIQKLEARIDHMPLESEGEIRFISRVVDVQQKLQEIEQMVVETPRQQYNQSMLHTPTNLSQLIAMTSQTPTQRVNQNSTIYQERTDYPEIVVETCNNSQSQESLDPVSETVSQKVYQSDSSKPDSYSFDNRPRLIEYVELTNQSFQDQETSFEESKVHKKQETAQFQNEYESEQPIQKLSRNEYQSKSGKKVLSTSFSRRSRSSNCSKSSGPIKLKRDQVRLFDQVDIVEDVQGPNMQYQELGGRVSNTTFLNSIDQKLEEIQKLRIQYYRGDIQSERLIAKTDRSTYAFQQPSLENTLQITNNSSSGGYFKGCLFDDMFSTSTLSEETKTRHQDLKFKLSSLRDMDLVLQFLIERQGEYVLTELFAKELNISVQRQLIQRLSQSQVNYQRSYVVNKKWWDSFQQQDRQIGIISNKELYSSRDQQYVIVNSDIWLFLTSWYEADLDIFIRN